MTFNPTWKTAYKFVYSQPHSQTKEFHSNYSENSSEVLVFLAVKC